MPELVKATFSAFVSESAYMEKDSLWEADHPFVLEHPTWFVPVSDGPNIIRTPVVAPEPEVKRGPGRPRKDTTA